MKPKFIKFKAEGPSILVCALEILDIVFSELIWNVFFILFDLIFIFYYFLIYKYFFINLIYI